MQTPKLTPNDIRANCSAQSFARGEVYDSEGRIGNPVRHGDTLWALCQGTAQRPYPVRVELTPGGIADAACGCPYRGDGYCKHIVALLLTYIHAPEVFERVESLLAELRTQPKSQLVRLLEAIFHRKPELVALARHSLEFPATLRVESDLDADPSLETRYARQLDKLFGNRFLAGAEVEPVLQKFNRLKTHGVGLAQQGEIELARATLFALIQTSIDRYGQTSKGAELPRFVAACAEALAGICITSEPVGGMPRHQYTALLDLSFCAERVFTQILTTLLAQVAAPEGVDLAGAIRPRLAESPNRRAHVRLLLSHYAATDCIEAYLEFARQEGEHFKRIVKLFELKRADEAWKCLQQVPLRVNEYQHLLQMPPIQGKPTLRTKLLLTVETVHPPVAIALHKRLVTAALVPRKRHYYGRVANSLAAIQRCYKQLGQDAQWRDYFDRFRQTHKRKSALLALLAGLDED